MKPASTALINLLNAARASPDAQLIFADAFVFTLQPSGDVLCYTGIDVPFAFTDYNGNHFSALANSIRIEGLKYKAAVGLNVDQQQVTAAALSTDTITGGGAFLQAMREGAFDGCEIVRYRVFFSDKLGGTVVGAVLLFKGRMGQIQQVGRTSAKFTVNSDLVLLDNYMPRNVYQPTCLHKLYDSGCTLSKSNFGFAGAVGAGSTATRINWTVASANFAQGTITFTSGVNDGVTATVGGAQGGAWLTLIYPLEEPCTPGDTFIAYYGCDHTLSTCAAKFNNAANFRGFPYVPPVSDAF
jgi:uncharacterized phage protein (TIGR02218 family)